MNRGWLFHHFIRAVEEPNAVDCGTIKKAFMRSGRPRQTGAGVSPLSASSGASL